MGSLLAQRAAIAAELATMEIGDNRGAHRPKKDGSNDPPLQSDALSIEQAADLLAVSAPSVKRAKARMKDDPEAHLLNQLSKPDWLPPP